MALSLEQALAIAIQNHIGLQIEELTTDIASYTYQGSWGAFDPLLSAAATLTDSEYEAQSIFQGGFVPIVVEENSANVNTGLAFPLTTGGTLSLGFDTTHSVTNSAAAFNSISTTDLFSVSYVQPLLRGAWRSYATSVQRQEDLNWRKQQEHRRQMRQEVLLAVEIAYWDLVGAREALDVADVTLNLGREQLLQNQRRLEAGVGTEVDVLQAEANVAVRIEQRLLAEVTVKNAADQLKSLLLGASSAQNWDIEIEPTTLLPEQVWGPAPPWESALAVALEQRPEIRQSRLEIQRAEIDVVRARSERKPGLDLTLTSGSRGFDRDAGEAFDTAVGWDLPSNSAALTFSVPIGNRTARYAERTARALLRSSHLASDQTELDIATEVRDAVRQVDYQVEAVTAAKASLALSQRQLEAEQARYREGLSTTFQVLEFQSQLAQALLAEKRSRLNFVRAQAALSKAQGLTGERGQP